MQVIPGGGSGPIFGRPGGTLRIGAAEVACPDDDNMLSNAARSDDRTSGIAIRRLPVTLRPV